MDYLSMIGSLSSAFSGGGGSSSGGPTDNSQHISGKTGAVNSGHGQVVTFNSGALAGILSGSNSSLVIGAVVVGAVLIFALKR